MKSINIPNEELINLAQNHTINEIANLYLCSRSTISKKLQQLNIKARKPKKIVSEQGRKNISLAKIKFYKENPDKHNWKRNDNLNRFHAKRLKNG
jgi:DNA-binding transcriptional MocR family regulator